ncbi:MAG: hypothetical protein A4E66_02713 [Syntrophus sp. PtaB.Bin001]|nr:MAG: hypothetical protein A4E66_02713 [Syntrophus sp. PtaB.Bin001]
MFSRLHISLKGAFGSVRLDILADDEGLDGLSLLMRNDGQGGGQRIGAQGEPSGGGDLGVCQHICQETADEVHPFRIQGCRLAVEVVGALFPRGQGKRRIFTVFKGFFQDDVNQTLLHGFSIFHALPPYTNYTRCIQKNDKIGCHLLKVTWIFMM